MSTKLLLVPEASAGTLVECLEGCRGAPFCPQGVGVLVQIDQDHHGCPHHQTLPG
jgi:hypothetical protein